MKLIILITILFCSLPGFSQRNLTIRKNQTKSIVTSISSLLIDTLIIEDNGKIVIEDNVPAFSLIAKFAIIGNNVTISGTRKMQTQSEINAQNGNNATDNCNNGEDGKNGPPGYDGKDAADIFLYLRIKSIGSLKIIAYGNDGTPGVNGGNGGIGSNSIFNCVAKKGGRGGNGGMGGNGGNGGTVVFNYTFIDESGGCLNNQTTLTNGQLNAEIKGGKGGEGGLGGQKGSPGKKLNGIIDLSLNETIPISINGSNGKAGKQGNFIKTVIKQNL